MNEREKRITAKLEKEGFNIFEFPRIKATVYGEFIELTAVKKPRKQLTEEEKKKNKKQRAKNKKLAELELERQAEKEKLLADPEYRKNSPFFYKLLLQNKEETEKWNKVVQQERLYGDLRASSKRLYQFIHTNFYHYQGIHVTLTYRNPQYDETVVYHDFKVFWQMLKYHYPNLGYISVIEPHKNGSWHFHLLLKDIRGKPIYVPYKDIRSYWKHGFCYISKMNPDEDYGWYFKKKITKDNPLLSFYKKGIRYFRYSRNMAKPEVVIFDEESSLDIFEYLDSYKKINDYSLSIYQEDFDEENKSVKLNQFYYEIYIKQESSIQHQILNPQKCKESEM